MNKKELIEAVAKSTKMTNVDAEKIVKIFTDEVTKSLGKSEKVALVGFGTFSVADWAARSCSHPRTGEKMTIPAKKVVKFKPGKNLVEKVQ